MWSLSEASGRRRIDRDALLDAWLERLGPLFEELRSGHFDGLRWADAQITTGAAVVVETGSDTSAARPWASTGRVAHCWCARAPAALARDHGG